MLWVLPFSLPNPSSRGLEPAGAGPGPLDGGVRFPAGCRGGAEPPVVVGGGSGVGRPEGGCGAAGLPLPQTSARDRIAHPLPRGLRVPRELPAAAGLDFTSASECGCDRL